jgi:uncharacterized protein with GYD domain
MATYVSLVNFTEQGVRDIKATTERAEKFRAAAQKAGVDVKDVFWTMGAYDIVLIMDGPDDKAIAAVIVNLASLGNVKTQTLLAFNAAEMKEIVSKAGK